MKHPAGGGADDLDVADRAQREHRRPLAEPAREQHRPAVGHDQTLPLPARDRSRELEQRMGCGERRQAGQHEPDRPQHAQPRDQDRRGGGRRHDHRRAQERGQQHDAVLAADKVHALAGREQTVELGHGRG